jgi:hypothetical protein
MISCFLIGKDFNLGTEFARLPGDDPTHPIHSGFIVGGRFGFDEKLEQ